MAMAVLRVVLCVSGLVTWSGASDPLTYHGGSILAMAGKKSVALVLDKRLGQGNVSGVFLSSRVSSKRSEEAAEDARRTYCRR